jgi:hypothetical protein
LFVCLCPLFYARMCPAPRYSVRSKLCCVQEILCALPPFCWLAIYLDTWFWHFREPRYSYAHPFPLLLLCYAMAGAVVARLSPRSLGLFLRPSCGICGSQNGALTGFLRVLRFPLVDIFSPKLLSFVSLI